MTSGEDSDGHSQHDIGERLVGDCCCSAEKLGLELTYRFREQVKHLRLSLMYIFRPLSIQKSS